MHKYIYGGTLVEDNGSTSNQLFQILEEWETLLKKVA